ncbi:hypothetical protein BD769DRAFT_1436769 [Suillus cothurnatus]|nr:hypothetical protein BD769DRAFT_1436769 [Suillus cothurnatus]
MRLIITCLTVVDAKLTPFAFFSWVVQYTEGILQVTICLVRARPRRIHTYACDRGAIDSDSQAIILYQTIRYQIMYIRRSVVIYWHQCIKAKLPSRWSISIID